MKKIFFLLILILNISCQNEKFEFDSIYHYQNKISDENFFDLLKESESSDNSAALEEILTENHISDFYKTFEFIEKNYTEKELVNSQLYSEIKEIYKNDISYEDSKCIPIYRDVLVFKMNDSIVAISKICYDCDKQYTLKSNLETIEIDNEKILKLKNLLK
ncbi:hypothetical protein [Flavobacterium sp. I3-2]|uniref:hypothetical protein n=1 Tax=Flavobacterium sp. I3-2 TaxID=2748319 RepID=UPI0015AA962F|nr:hypothetical protein [Flavobacterium sp. I3-2]